MEVSIIGAGISGLSTALVLHKLGIRSTVYEKASNLNEIGAGVWLQPNAMQVLDWLDLKDKIRDSGVELDKMEIVHPDLTPIKEISSNVVQDAFGNQTVAIHRGRLQKILFDAFSRKGQVVLGQEFKGLHTNRNELELELSTRNVVSELIIGADGIHSQVRDSLGFPSKFRNSNQICWRGISKFQLPDALRSKGKEAWGKKIRFGFSPISPSEVYFFAVANKESASADLKKEELAELFQDFDPIVGEIILNSGPMHVCELSDLVRLPKWSKGAVCLIGDAAHATTPNMGQGACQGIEDAYNIGHALKEYSNVEDAFSHFESSRRKKVDYIVNTSWTFGKMIHRPLSQSLLKLMMKATPASVMSNQMNKMYKI